MSPLKKRIDHLDHPTFDESFSCEGLELRLDQELPPPPPTPVRMIDQLYSEDEHHDHHHVYNHTPVSRKSTPSNSKNTRRSSLNSSGDDLLPLDMLPDEACFSPSSSSVGSTGSSSSEDGLEPSPDEENAEREIFHKARHYLNPGPLLRSTIYLFGERKLLTFFCVHFVCTMVIWAHFFFIKFDQKTADVPRDAPFYWWKVIVPPLEFGSMHAILFQMALIPLTMCRYSIASLSESAINKFIPLNRMFHLHIHLGYTICIILILATVMFFAFFGLLCANGDEAVCAKFTSEIMCTGYGIIATILIIIGTSHFRDRIPHELFYSIHHLVFVFYAITIAHTLDDKQRNHEQQRSQTFKWFSSTLLYYLCDRAAMYLNHRYTSRLISSSTIKGSNGSRMIILRLKRPAIFSFKPGQYAYLRLHGIDKHWHPFSIASGPASSYLEFYIEVYNTNSWTDKLWALLEGDGDGGFSHKQIDVDILGPCGTSLAKTEDFSHVLAVGAGTGIVPILALYKQHVRQLLRLDPWNHFNDLQNHRRKIMAAEKALAPRKGSFCRKVANTCAPICQRHDSILDAATNAAVGPDDSLASSIREKINRHERMMRWRDVRGSIRDMQAEAFQATRSIYGVVLLALMPAMGALLIGLTISWNTTSTNLREEMTSFLQIFTVAFQAVFAFIAICVWDGNELLAYTDFSLCLVAPFADWYWFLQFGNDEGRLNPGDISTYCLLIGYMTARLWIRTVEPRHKSWRKSVDTDGISALDRLEIVWVSRSASLVSELMPDINCIWDALAKQWGKDNATKVCKISVYVTDKDDKACELLKTELSGTELFRDGAIHFGRPDFGTLVEDHTLQMITTRKKSYSLLAFCGSRDVAKEIHHHKISNDMITAVTGNKAHQMEFVSESYGGSSRKKTDKSPTEGKKEKGGDCLTTRTVISYGPQKSRRFLV